jgi:methylenetetrahydrofolate reductase (NADPH)
MARPIANWISMLNINESGREAPAVSDLKSRIVSFMQGASTEITPAEEGRLPELAAVLPSGTAVYVAHTPHASFAQVIHAAIAVRRAGFLAMPHIAVRRVPDSGTLRAGLAELRAGGVEDILLIAGDAPRPVGEFSGTLDILESRIIEESGIARMGIAGHPEGHNAVPTPLLWEALEAKQAFAARAGVSMHIVTQFGLNGAAFRPWLRELERRQILLPVRIGIAGPAPMAKLLHFALQCGIGASMRAVMRNLSSAAHSSDLATTPDQHLLGLLGKSVPAQIVAPHFFAFGGALETARWMRKVAAGGFEIDSQAGRLKILIDSPRLGRISRPGGD